MTNELPEFVEDKLGNEVRLGDRIVVVSFTHDGITTGPTLNVGTVLRFCFGKAKGQNVVKMEVYREPELRYAGGPTKHYQPLLIDPLQKRFVKIGRGS